MPFLEHQNPVLLAHHIWENHLQDGNFVFDATLGNGHDLKFLFNLKKNLVLSGIDIQEKAIENAKELLGEDSSKIHWICDSHEQIDLYAKKDSLNLITYNLGYLPGGDKEITTLTKSTLSSLNKSLDLLKPSGLISIVCYPGHEEGAKEELAVINWASALPKKKFCVTHTKWTNRDKSPSLFLVAKQMSPG